MDDLPLTTLAPILQYGFAGFSLVLVGVIVWLVKQLLAMLRATNRTIAANTAAIVTLTATTGEVKFELAQMRDETLRRGCPFAKAPALPPSAQPAYG